MCLFLASLPSPVYHVSGTVGFVSFFLSVNVYLRVRLCVSVKYLGKRILNTSGDN